jgi:hypothetical protein
MLKSKINKADFDALPEALKQYYKANGDHYLLESDDAVELRNAKDREAEARRIATERADRLQAEKDAAEAATNEALLAKAKKEKDVEALEASWQAKLDAAVNAEVTKRTKREDQLRELLVENKAIELANELSISPKLILPHIRERLAAELDGDKPITRVLDADKQPTAKTLAELKQEFIDNKDFASIIKGSKGSGGGAGGSGSGGGADGKKFTDLSETERVALHAENPVKFREMAHEAGITLPN